MGLIRRRKDRDVPDRVHFSVNINWKPGMANLPKRLKAPSATRTDPSVMRTTPPSRHADRKYYTTYSIK